LERVTPSPAIFDFNKLHWLNRHYLKLADPERIAVLARPYFEAKNWLPGRPDTGGLDSAGIDGWFQQLLTLLLAAVDQLDQLPEKATYFFQFDPAAAMSNEENAAILAGDSAQTALRDFAARVGALPAPVSAEAFKAAINEVKAATGVKGKDLFHPIRIAITGAHSGPEFDKLVPLIETGSQLSFPTPIVGVQQRVQQFVAALQ
ncbi:MAG: glutamate--tRNA ligase, partial [Acidobacteriaceae bacterium]